MTVQASWRSVAALCVLAPLTAVAHDHEEHDEEPVVPTTLEELKAEVEKAVEEYDIPSVGIAVVDESGPLWIDAFGYADIESERAATTDTMYRIGSTSKMFVALAVLKLVEEGKLSLDDKLADLAPEIEFENPWEETDPVRVVHLLEHTTGWDDLALREYAHNDPAPATLKFGLDYHPASRTSRWKPGTRSSYCNSGPPIAAYIVQKITGQEFESWVQDRFFTPMGMQTMTYRLSEDVEKLGVTSYQGDEPQDYWHIIMRPSGSINASPKDMAKFVSLYLNRGRVGDTALVSEASLARMETVGSTPAAAAGQHAGYALHNYSSIYEQWDFRTHNGGVNGGLTELSYLPSAGRGYAFMINSGNGQAFGEISRLVRSYLTHDLEAPASPEPVAITDGHKALTGLYRLVNPRQEMSRFIDYVLGIRTITVDDEALSTHPLIGGADNVSRYLPVSGQVFIDEESRITTLSAVNDAMAGSVVHIGTSVYEPVSPVVVYGQLVVVAVWLLSIVISIPYLLVWGVRRLRGKIPPGPTIRVRTWPLLAGLSIIAFVVLFIVAASDPFEKLGKPGVFSILILLMTIAFAVFAVLGLVTAWRERATPMNRVNYWFSTISSSAHVLVAVYLLSYGVIGMTTWG
ncbi:MAG: serine hydrolase domain-containing protein [Pseudomonadota bacterium]